MEKVIIDYSKYSILLNALLEKILMLGKKFKAVHGLPRGGLPIAVHISHFLDIPLVVSLNQFLQEYASEELLVIDDIIDTGNTFSRFLELTDMSDINFTFVTLFYKPRSPYIPDVYVKETTSWIIFPWEPIDEKPSEYHQDIYPEFNDYLDDDIK